jgi:hypothetical protein
MTSDLSVIYVQEPDIPAGITIADYRRSRSSRRPWWRRAFGSAA